MDLSGSFPQRRAEVEGCHRLLGKELGVDLRCGRPMGHDAECREKRATWSDVIAKTIDDEIMRVLMPERMGEVFHVEDVPPKVRAGLKVLGERLAMAQAPRLETWAARQAQSVAQKAQMVRRARMTVGG